MTRLLVTKVSMFTYILGEGYLHDYHISKYPNSWCSSIFASLIFSTKMLKDETLGNQSKHGHLYLREGVFKWLPHL